MQPWFERIYQRFTAWSILLDGKVVDWLRNFCGRPVILTKALPAVRKVLRWPG